MTLPDAAHDDDPLVNVLDISFSKPEMPTRNQRLFLSSLDIFWVEFLYNRRVLFYQLSLEQQPMMIAKLKSSLAQVLVHFYPVAGRLAVGPDGRTVIDCNDDGVEFVEASVDVSLQMWEKEDFQPCLFFNKLARLSEQDVSKACEMPLLSIQVTRFSCGGLAVGYAHTHVLADGHSMWHFMNSWAECARNEPVSIRPVHDRTAFKVDHPSAAIAARMNLPPPRQDAGGAKGGGVKPKERLVEELFHVSVDMIEKLKQKAREEQGVNFTSYEVMCAHWWRSVMKARNLEEETIVRLAVLANMRTRVTPPLPEAYFGNAIMFTFANSTATELCCKEGLGFAASKIRKASQECNEANMWAKVNWLELHNGLFGSRATWDGSWMSVSSSPKFQVYKVDFGWGKPAAVRTARVNGDGEAVLFCGRDKGIDVSMPLPRPTMERLLSDPHFLPSSSLKV